MIRETLIYKKMEKNLPFVSLSIADRMIMEMSQVVENHKNNVIGGAL